MTPTEYRTKIMAVLQRRRIPLTVKQVAAALNIDTRHGYNQEVTQVGNQLAYLWRSGAIRCNTIANKNRQYHISEGSAYVP